MSSRSTVVLVLLATVLTVSLASGAAAAALARWDNASVPAAITRAGVTFAGTLSVGLALTALLISAWP
ncbi:hypothetical protein QMA61_35170 [Streptomyces coelicoflavus]|uniref:hypothetical protein n=1 Tax=Streptomyces coelicoflavus TaxID=285562 RepID=UPI0024AD8B1A|nr:hypothetical protein [Streptomyces coelicoflavus]MDI6521423.1 hypothetical protein [Streptomyces coelicoflavus]